MLYKISTIESNNQTNLFIEVEVNINARIFSETRSIEVSILALFADTESLRWIIGYSELRNQSSCMRSWLSTSRVYANNYYFCFVGKYKILRHCPTCLALRLQMKIDRGSMKSSSALRAIYCWTFHSKPCVVTWCVNPASKPYSRNVIFSVYFP